MWRRVRLGEEEVRRRLPVWQAFSDLFLDTDLQPRDYRHVAQQLLQSGYSKRELWLILSDEVMPAFLTNLLSPAGEWAGWSEVDVERIMERSLRSKIAAPLKRRIGSVMLGSYLEQEWARIAASMEP